MKDWEKLKLIQENSDLEHIMSTPVGRRVVWRILSHCGIYRDIEGEGPSVFKQIGRRQVGLFLLSIISEAAEDQLELMIREAKANEKEEKIKYERANRESESELSEYQSGSDEPEF